MVQYIFHFDLPHPYSHIILHNSLKGKNVLRICKIWHPKSTVFLCIMLLYS